MSSKIKVDTIENVAGSGNVSLGSGHNLVVPGTVSVTGDLAVDTNVLKVDTSNNRVGINTTSPSNDLHISSTNPVIRLQDTSTNAYAQIFTNDAGSMRLRADAGNSQASSDFILEIDGTQQLSVDSSGRMLKPNQPRFQAYISTNISFSALADNQVVDFQSVNVNAGNHFSTSTHLFTAPVAGTYWFGVTLRIDNVGSTGGDYFHPYLGKNGTTGLEGTLNGRLIVTAETQNIFSMVTGSWIVQLAANDTIGFYHGDGASAGGNAGSAYYQSGQCNFGGYLLA